MLTYEQQALICTAKSLEVYDVRIKKLVEHVQFDGLSLVSPSIAYTSHGAMSYIDSVSDIAHSIRVYKGRIYLLVSVFSPHCFLF